MADGQDYKYVSDSDHEDNNNKKNVGNTAAISSFTSFNDFSLKAELLRAVKEAGFEKPSEV